MLNLNPAFLHYFSSVNDPTIVNYVDTIGNAIPIKDTFNFVFWILMSINLIIIAAVRTIHPAYIRVLFDTALHNRQLINNLREELNFSRMTSILLNLTYFNALAIIIWIAIKESNEYLMILLTFVLIGAAIFKLIFIRLIGVFANTKIGLQEHLLNHFIFFQVGGIILTPILIFTHYLPAHYVNLTLIIAASIIALLFVVREMQSFIRAVQYKISIIYIILYLCTLELMPLLVGVRVFILNSEILN